MKTWFQYAQNTDDLSRSGIQCRICQQYANALPSAANEASKRGMTFVTESGYVPNGHAKDSVRRKLQRHSSSLFHSEAINWMKEKHHSILARQINEMNRVAKLAQTKRDEITARVLTTVYAEVKANVPFSAHNLMVDLQIKNGLDMGSHHRHRKSATAMAESISMTMHKTLLKYIKNSKDLPISIVLDTTFDIHSNSYLMIYFRILENSNPMMFFYRFKRLAQVETGQRIYEMLIGMFTEDNILEGIKERLWGVTTDGAAVMTGNRAGLVSRLRPWAKNNFFQHHCAAHKLELSIYHAFENFPYMQHLDTSINSLYKFYMRHATKRKASLLETSEVLDKVFYELKRIYRIRWVASEVSALDVIRKSYYLLLTNLENIISTSSDFDDESKATASGLLKTLKNVRYYSLHLFLTDILKLLEFESLQFQSARGTFIGLQKRHNDLIRSLEMLKTNNGPRVIDFLNSCRCRRVVGPTADIEYRVRCHTNDLSHSDFVCPAGTDDSTQRFELKQPCSRLRRRGCSTDATDVGLYPALSEIRLVIIDSIVSQLRKYFPEDDYSIFDVLNPESLPTAETLHTVFTYSSRIIPLARRFGMQDESPVSGDSDSDSESDSRDNIRTISGQFSFLINSLVTSHKFDFCAYRSRGPVKFWSHFMEKRTVEWLPKIKKTDLGCPNTAYIICRG
ncbi:hypothetical protein BOX15_Mlig021755g1 [Macrostomum lignano]|uniref:DUF4371 domain-containing protein n=1 Tax=Macrostomum lignano TaxID=282301 RepID=A0A267GSP4_9PLAT|nr:hypothetical protein BOX15_Mlig021755g1 [Macrostomum lignano]